MTNHPINPLTNKPEDIEAQVRVASELIHRKYKEKMDAQAARIAELDVTLTCQREARDAWKEDYRETKTKLAASEQRAAALVEVYERASELTRGPSIAVAPADYRRAFSALTIACIAVRAALAAAAPSAASTAETDHDYRLSKRLGKPWCDERGCLNSEDEHRAASTEGE